LEETVRGHAPSFADDVYFYRDKICDKTRLAALYTDRTSASMLSSKTTRVLDYVQQCFAEYYKANRKAITELFESIADDNLTDEEARQKFEEEKLIVITDLRQRLSPTPHKLYEKALKSWAAHHSLPMRHTHEALKREVLCYEDALALLYVSILTGRVAADKSVRHILLDEAQDCCPLQHRILQRFYPSSHFTVLADTNQALYPHINLHDRGEIAALYPKAQTIPLSKSYRSTYEINRFAQGILRSQPDNEPDSSLYMRHGEEPEIIETTDPCTAVYAILNRLPKEYKTVGILLSDTKKACAFHGKLKKNNPVPNLHEVTLINSADNRFAPGIMVMAVPFAKGLEFDAVICPEYGQIDGKLLYLICTRALHRLFLFRDPDNQTHRTQ
jgi:DNA helicase IV